MQAKIRLDGAEWVSPVFRVAAFDDVTDVDSRYIHAPKLRAGLAAIWQNPELHHWWLPNDEGYLDLIREIRAMTEERTHNPRDQFREDVRDMKSVFGKMKLDDTDSENSPSSASHSAHEYSIQQS